MFAESVPALRAGQRDAAFVDSDTPRRNGRYGRLDGVRPVKKIRNIVQPINGVSRLLVAINEDIDSMYLRLLRQDMLILLVVVRSLDGIWLNTTQHSLDAC